MRKLSDYVEMAATEYLEETGRTDLDSLWIAEFFQDNGVQDDYPLQDLVAFYALVQKAITLKADRAEKLARLEVDKVRRSTKPGRG